MATKALPKSKILAASGLVLLCLAAVLLLCLQWKPRHTSLVYTSVSSGAALREASALPSEEEQAPAGTTVSVNTATEEELCTLSGIGSTKAQAIIAERELNGPFYFAEDLLQVHGIGEKNLEKIRNQLSFE